MSLLLEALKKAELAKQGARANTSENESGGRVELELEPIITREHLPDLSQTIEISTHDLTGNNRDLEPQITADRPSTEVADSKFTSPDSQRQSASSGGRSPSHPQPETQNPDEDNISAQQKQAAARQLFEAKEMDYNPRRPFYITVGVLLACGMGYGGYVYWQMQPRSIYVANAKPAPASGQVAREPNTPLPPGGPPSTANQPGQATSPSVTPNGAPERSQVAEAAGTAHGGGAPPQPASAQDRDVAAKGPSGATPLAAGQISGSVATNTTSVTQPTIATPQQVSARPPAPRRAQSSDAAGRPNISIATQSPVLDPFVEKGYEAFQQGDLNSSRDLYQRALQRDPSSRDALLGLAAIDTRTRSFESAEARYLRLLELDPKDANALAGLIALRGNADSVQSESRLKSLIAAQPEAPHLHFALGNQLAAQRRWSEAQNAFFKAYSLESENPDFAFNLAVSLDQLRQPKLALEYYRRALALTSARSASFDKTATTARIAELTRQ